MPERANPDSIVISHKYKFIFVHASRTGGSSVERMAGIDVTSDARTAMSGNTDFPEKHASFQYYRQRYPGYFKPYFKFTIVRNPYDRLVSAWLWIRNVIPRFAEQSLADFIRTRHEEYPYSSFLKLNGRSLEESLREFDFIARFERLDQDIAHICEQTGMDVQAFPHTNRTQKSDYREYYTGADRRLAERLLAEDAEAFGYHF